jgi:hypothetical protein
MSDLIEALQIFLKYGNPSRPTHCEHDTLHICGIEPEDVSEEDVVKLNKLGFHVSGDGFQSFRFGSA